ncbi:hypothetical protein QFZ94_008052 [Paraburkholderia sp. JPY465]
MERKPRSLHAMADKWLGLQPEKQVRAKRLAHGRRWRGSCVYVSAAGAMGEVGMFFFRHDDGAWYIFPPGESRPSIGALRTAA